MTGGAERLPHFHQVVATLYVSVAVYLPKPPVRRTMGRVGQMEISNELVKGALPVVKPQFEVWSFSERFERVPEPSDWLGIAVARLPTASWSN